MTAKQDNFFVSRGGPKLAHALEAFAIDPAGWVCADLGCSTGGFTDVLLQRAAARVYAVDTGYGVLDWRLRNDGRVVVMERTNALHVTLPEPMDLVVVDANWTRQALILPKAAELLKEGGRIVSLLKPHYEVDAEGKARLRKTKGVLPEEEVPAVVERVVNEIQARGLRVMSRVNSPVRGSAGKNARGNREILLQVIPRPLTVAGYHE